MRTIKSENDGSQNGQAEIDSHRLRVILRIDTPGNQELPEVSETLSRIVRAFSKLNWDHEFVLLLDKPEHHPRLVEFLSSQVDHFVEGNLADAIKVPSEKIITKHVVVDLGFDFDDVQWNWLLRSSQTADVACCFSRRPTQGRLLIRFTQLIGSVVSRLVLGTAKNGFRPGIVVFDPAKVEPVLADGLAFDSPEELLATCRHDGQTVFEAQIKGAASGVVMPLTFPKSLDVHAQNIRFWWNNIAFPGTGDQQAGRSHQNDIARSSATTRWIATAVLLIAASLILFTRLGYPFFEPDEARNAQLALNICESGNWMCLTLDDESYWDKPPLQAWMTATCYRLLGASEFATRLPCAIASFLTIVFVFVLGGRLFGFRVGFMGATLLLMCCGFSIAGRYVTMDASLTCFATVMLLSTVLAVRTRTIRYRWLVVAGVACGLGFLTKGPVIAILVLPPILAAGWLEKNEFYKSPRFWLYPGAAAFLISAPWFLAMGLVHPDFIVYFFWEHNVVRFSDAFVHKQPWWFYVPVVFLAMYPISFLLPSFAKWVASANRFEKRQLGNEFGVSLLFVVWVIFFFSLSESKLPTYILPALPVICLLLGKMLDLCVFTHQPVGNAGKLLSTIPRHIANSVTILFFIFACLLVFVFSNRDPMLVTNLVLGCIALITLVVCSRRKNMKISWMAAIAATGMFATLSVTQLVPNISQMRSVQIAASRLADSPKLRNVPIVFVGRPPHAHSFCLPNKIIYHFGHHREAVGFLCEHPETILVASKNDIKKLQKQLNGAIYFEHESGHRKLYTSHSRYPIDSSTVYKSRPIGSPRQAQMPRLMR